MIHSKSKIRCIADTEMLDYEQLAKLCRALILDDKVNFNCNKVGQGFPESTARMIADKIEGVDKDSDILIFNNFSLILYDMLKERGYTNVYICYRDFSSETGCQIVYNIMKDYISANFVEAEEILSRVVSYGEVLGMSKKFDLIISNPPYAIGNQITRAIVDNVEFDTLVNLMPASKYKGGKLYEYVSELSSAEDTFEDAAVGDSLTVAILKKENAGVYHSYDEFENEKRDPRYQEFYRLNATKTSHIVNYSYANKFYKGCDSTAYAQAKSDLMYWWEAHNTKFCITWRAVLDGTHATDGAAFDISWNLRKVIDEDALPISQSAKRNTTAITVDFIDFDSAQACSNFTKFFYAGGKLGLMNNLIKGLCKTSGSIAAAIPNIDWSVERDYENLTLEEIMTILREEA